MSIATKTGDGGTTGLMYNRRVSKSDPRVEAYGTVDELNAALGLARAHAKTDFMASHLFQIQKSLVILMGELATAADDRDRYQKDGFEIVTSFMTAKLDALVAELEGEKISFKGWATPGATVEAACLDVARTVCRRAERRAHELEGKQMLPNHEILIFLNRLSDTLWLLARRVETQLEE
jgi:cob(I)alamin adenosyltransferase